MMKICKYRADNANVCISIYTTKRAIKKIIRSILNGHIDNIACIDGLWLMVTWFTMNGAIV